LEHLRFMIRNSILILFCLIGFAGLSQYRDAGMWTSVALQTDINKKLTVSVSPELRLNENLTQVSRAFIDYGAQYKIKKFLFATATWRGGLANTGDYFETRRRLQLGLGTRYRTGDLGVTLTSRWQLSTNPNRAETDVDFTTTWRNKLALKYSVNKKTDLATSIELFHQEGRSQALELTDWRWMASVERSIKKRHSIELGYLIQKNIVASPQELDYVILLTYHIDINFKKKKKGDKENTSPTGTQE